MTDIIAKLKQGDERAFQELVGDYQGMVYNTALGMLQHDKDAEDVAQEVFIKVYESVQQFKGDSSISTWIYRITISKCLDHIRRKSRKKRFAKVRSLFGVNDELEIDPPHFNHPGVVLDRKEQAAILFKMIDKLPDNQKAAFVLSKVEGLSTREIATVLDTSVSGVEGLLHRAKVHLRKDLEIFYKNGAS